MNLEEIWSETLTQLAAHLNPAELAQLRADCQLTAAQEQGEELALTLGVNQLDTLNMVKHQLSRHLITYLGLAAGAPVTLSLAYTGTGQAEPRHYLRVMTAQHILSGTWPEPAWVIPGLLPAGLTLLAGRQKIGKSWLALQLCRAVTYHLPVWERPAPAGSFLYLALEDTPRRLQGRMQKQIWGESAELKNSGFILRDQFEKQIGFLDEEGSGILAEQIERQRPRLVVIDTLGRAVRGDVNDYEVMTTALSPIQNIALQKNCAILIIDHHRKLFGGDIDVVVDILGSSAKAAVADTIWGLYKQRGSGQVKLGMVGRDVEDNMLTLAIDPSGLWQLVQEGEDGLEITPRRQEILDALAQIGPASVDLVAEAINQNRGNTHTRLQDLVDAGLVRRGKQGNSIVYSQTGAGQ